MINVVCDLLMKLGEFIAQTANVGCFLLVLADEPECPQSLID